MNEPVYLTLFEDGRIAVSEVVPAPPDAAGQRVFAVASDMTIGGAAFHLHCLSQDTNHRGGDRFREITLKAG